MSNEIILNTIFQLKRGTAEAWTRNNPTLRSAEPGYETDTGRLKIGDGATVWNDLSYFGGDYSISIDEKSIKFNDAQLLELSGFTVASAGMIPRKNENGELEWYLPTETTVEEVVQSETFASAVSTQVEEVIVGTTETPGVLEDYQKVTDTISVTRLVNDEETVLIFNGGTAENAVLS